MPQASGPISVAAVSCNAPLLGLITVVLSPSWKERVRRGVPGDITRGDSDRPNFPAAQLEPCYVVKQLPVEVKTLEKGFHKPRTGSMPDD